jgi:PAS domain S-box-containing protein
MERSDLADIVGAERDGGATTDGSATVCPLVVDTGNRRVLQEWLAEHETYTGVDSESHPLEADFDLCIIDEEALREYREELETLKSDAEPILLPVLLLLPETRSDVVALDRGEVADNVLPTTIDEVVSLPIQQMELEWRIQSLLRLRAQSITAQSRNEELRLFQQAVESSGYAIYITDTEGTIKYVNDAFERITGYTRDEAVGQTPRLLNSGELSEEFFADLWETVLAGDVWEGDIVDRRKNGELYAATQTVAPVAEDGEIRAFVAVQNDITERTEREETLQRRTHAIDEAPVGITITDPDRDDNPMIYVNDAFVEMTGYPRAEVIGRNCRFLQGPDTDPDRVASVRESIDAEEPVSIDLRNYRKDGTEFWNHLDIAPVRDDDGVVTNWVGFQQDVTGRKRRLRQLGIIDRTLRHNLRNDMNVIRGQAETIRAQTDGEVAASAEQIVATSDDLVTMAEKEHAITELLRDVPQQVETDVASLLRRVAATQRSEHPDATIEVVCPESLTVSASAKLERAIRELVTNAIRHNDSSAPEVEVVATETDQSVRIDVADNGPRIPEMERDILLEDDHRTPLYHGSGLGLWLVKLIVTQSNGRVIFTGNSPQGNVIRVELIG